jgi:hypothetical protein
MRSTRFTIIMLAGSASKSFIGFAPLFCIIAVFIYLFIYYYYCFWAMINNKFNEFYAFDYYAMVIFHN